MAYICWMRVVFILLCAVLNLASLNAQNASPAKKSMAKVVAGPMLGYAEHREVSIWIQTEAVQEVSLRYKLSGSSSWEQVKAKPNELGISRFTPALLSPGSSYTYQILLDGKVWECKDELNFKTKTLWEWRTPAPDFTFLLGSCLYINDSAYDRPGKAYGASSEILKFMKQTPADFMLWLGDNTYLREADFSSKSGMAYRYKHTRADSNLQGLLRAMPNYATWDDHDYGDNDGNSSFGLKKTSRSLFMDYWPNKTYGEDEQGVYHSFSWSDAEFFLCDDRWFRDASEMEELDGKKAMLGKKQLEWLKNKLVHSKATFKFIVVGGQVLNKHTDKESYNLYKKEREELLNFLVQQKISGVVFLSGDRHHTEILKDESVKEKLGYSLYDITSSPLSSGVSNVLKTDEAKNPQRVPNTLTVEQNYCSIRISGKKGERIALVTCYDKNGLVKWGYQIPESELKTGADKK